MPGKDPGGIFITILIGIAGAIVGGFLGSFIGLGKVESFDLGGIFIATIGAITPDRLSIAQKKNLVIREPFWSLGWVFYYASTHTGLRDRALLGTLAYTFAGSARRGAPDNGRGREGRINRCGNTIVRYTLIEMVWRLIRWQPDYPRIKKLRNALLSKRGKRRLIVAAARRLAIDLWRLATGRATVGRRRAGGATQYTTMATQTNDKTFSTVPLDRKEVHLHQPTALSYPPAMSIRNWAGPEGSTRNRR